MNKVPMTLAGHKALEIELADLKKVQRPRVINAISEARAHGDLKENAEYHAAREEQSFMEGRIQEIESKLSMAHVIDVTALVNDGKIIFGATVTIMNADSGEEVTYQIVGDDEADIKKSKISISSPIARALIGKYVDDEVTVQAPQGELVYDVVAVEYL